MGLFPTGKERAKNKRSGDDVRLCFVSCGRKRGRGKKRRRLFWAARRERRRRKEESERKEGKRDPLKNYDGEGGCGPDVKYGVRWRDRKDKGRKGEERGREQREGETG